jgi:flavin reductase (DIM6/NTAB) family NADH-FMN oxidoreductase RutF
MTTRLKDQLHGMTVSAFASVSLQPLLVLVSVEKSTLMHRLVTQSRVFAINILPEREEATSRFFADNERLGKPEFAAGAFEPGVTGSPLLRSATAYVEARLRAIYDGGDHALFLGEVAAVAVRSQEAPLVFYRGGYTGIKGG